MNLNTLNTMKQALLTYKSTGNITTAGDILNSADEYIEVIDYAVQLENENKKLKEELLNLKDGQHTEKPILKLLKKC